MKPHKFLFFLFYSCFITPCTLAQCGCSVIDNSEDLDSISNPYENKTSSDFIAVFGDIQYYTNTTYIDLFEHSLNWINYAANNINILCVLHTGDITNQNGISTNWQYFGKAINSFSPSIPFVSNIGDHDYDWKGALIYDRYSTHFNEYTQSSAVMTRIEATFEPGRMENIVVRNEIHGERYDLLLLEFGPRKEVVEWARNWVSSHPDIKYILMNHEYLEMGGGRKTKGLKCKMRLKGGCVTPEELWNKLIRCNDNIAWVLCGHVGGLYAVTYEKNDFGREVCQMQHNIQGKPYRYDNWLMMWEFPEKSDEAIVSIVNTRTGLLFGGNNELFKFKYRY